MLKAVGPWIVDGEGRRLILRGANVSGSSKTPAGLPSGADALSSREGATFVGRPFPLAEAGDRFRELKDWGLRFVRLLVTWEAIEHAGPGAYDRAYLEYLRAIAEEAARSGILLYVDPHQDAWSRWTGGDGAPAWTLTELGFDLGSLSPSGAALIHGQDGSRDGRMIWPTNYNRLACATMFTLFFGGNDFAPGLRVRGDLRVRGEPVQEFLQGSYLRAFAEAAKALKGLPNVAGFGVMNEPNPGFIGLRDASRLERAMMRRGAMPSPFEAMAAGEGFPASVERWAIDLFGNHRAGRAALNPSGIRAWREGADCPWRREGIWDVKGGKPVLLKPGYFATEGGVTERWFKPFYKRFISEIRSIIPGALAFIEGIPYGEHLRWTGNDPGGVVNAAHWYDDLAMISKSFQEFVSIDSTTMRFSFGRRGIARGYERSIGRWKERSERDMGGVPTLIGEFGLPFDLNKKAAYRRVARGADPARAFRLHERALSGYYGALDALLLSAAIWNYSPDNDPDGGDRWNGEDLSIYCRAHGGPRALRGFSRPYAARTAGVPLRMSFDPRNARFEFEYDIDGAVSAPTEIFLPACWYPREPSVALKRGGAEWKWDEGERILSLRASGAGRIGILVEPGKA